MSLTPALKADYRFQNTLNSSVAGAPALANLGLNNFNPTMVDGTARTVLDFARNDGLSLSTAGLLPGGSYSVVMLFALSEVSDYRRLLDFKNASSDTGLYNLGGSLNFYDQVTGPGAPPIIASTFVQVVLTRDPGQKVVGYVDGVEQFHFVDSTNLAVLDSNNPLRFFRDEDPFFPNEASAGSVARIRLYDGAFSPAEVAALDRLPGGNSPNLIPFQPSGWSDSIVVSKTTGTTMDSAGLTTADPLFVDWAVINNGAVATTASFITELHVDGALRASWSSAPPLSPMAHAFILDHPIGSLSVGSHTIRIKTDSSAVIAESNEGDNEYTRTIIVTGSAQPVADLHLEKQAEPAEVFEGEVVDFQIFLRNHGPDAADNIQVTDVLPADLILVGFSPHPGTTFDPSTGTWQIPSLGYGQTNLLILTATKTTPGTVTNSAVITGSDASDPNPNNNFFASPALWKPARADLVLTKIGNTNRAEITNTIEFDITIENLGPRPARNIVVREVLPAQLYIADVPQVPAGTTWGMPTTRSWQIPNLAVSEKLTLRLSVAALRGGTFTNGATITAAQPLDPIPANNEAAVEITFVGYAACGVARLCDPVLGPAHTNATVRLRKGNDLISVTRTDDRGAFCFTNLAPGTYQLTVEPAEASSCILGYEEDVEVGPNTGELKPWSKWLIITGRITFGPGGPPVPGVSVSATFGATTKTTNTDPNGVYLFTGLEEERYTVTPAAPAAGMSFQPASQNVGVGTFALSCTNTADFILKGQLKIEGRLTACEGKGRIVVPYAVVTLNREQFPNLRTLRSGTDGTYIFSNLPPGKYAVRVTHPTISFNPASKDVTLMNKNVTTNFSGSAADVIGGRVVGRNGAPLSGIEVRLVNPQLGVNQSVSTDAEGGFLFNNLQAAFYRVTPVPTPGQQQQGLAFSPVWFDLAAGNPNLCQNHGRFVGTFHAVEVAALEVVQVIQDWQNRVPLVEGKPTLVRAFLKPVGTNQMSVPVFGLQLKVERGGQTLGTLAPQRPAGLLEARADYALESRRRLPELSVPFELSAAQAKGELKLTLEWPRGVLTTYLDPAGQQTAVRNNATTVKFEPAPALPLNWVRVSWTFGAKKQAAPRELVTEQRKRMLAGLPTVSIPVGTLREFAWSPLRDPESAGEEDIELNVNHLEKELKRDLRNEPRRNLYHAVLAGTKLGGKTDRIGGRISFADMSFASQGRSKNTATHELGHVLGRHHSVHSAYGFLVDGAQQYKRGRCEEEAEGAAPDFPMDQYQEAPLAPTLGPMRLGDYRFAYGWDSADRHAGRPLGVYVSPFQTADLMSYCEFDTKWTWPGIHTYTNLARALTARFGAGGGAAPAPGSPQDASVPVEYLVISGLVEAVTPLVFLDPILQDIRTEPPDLPEPGPYLLRLLDANGGLRGEVPFMPEFPPPEENESTALGYGFFVFHVPRPNDLGAVEILHDGAVLARRVVSPHAPSVQFVTPVGGVVASNGPLPVVWSALDPDGDALTYTLEFSADGGTNYATLAFDLTTNAFEIAAGALRGSSQARLRVTASDGLNVGRAETGALLIPDGPPEVEILQPGPNEALVGTGSVILRASAWDAEDGDLPPAQSRWSSDRDGDLGVGPEVVLEASRLAEGDHVLSITATDSALSTRTASLPVRIERTPRVVLTVRLEGDEIELSWPLSAATLRVWAAFSIDSPQWFPVEGEPVELNQRLVLRVRMQDEALFFRLAGDP